LSKFFLDKHNENQGVNCYKISLALLIAAGVSACNQNKTETKPAAATTAGTTGNS
jgi:hypothetical protein